MGPIEFNKRRIFILVGSLVAFFIVYQGLTFYPDEVRDVTEHVSIPGWNSNDHKVPLAPSNEDDIWDYAPEPPPSSTSSVPDTGPTDQPWGPTGAPAHTPTPAVEHYDLHPINQLMKDADVQWRKYETGMSTTFRQTVEKYRSKYGRHPPPGFKEWYKFARERDVFNIDDFEQIMDDLRPFWAINASEIRASAAHMWENFDFGTAVIHIRDHKIIKVENPFWRSDTMSDMIAKFIKHLPDMDIPMNRLDQPRVIVPWEDMQEHLRLEYETRTMGPDAMYNFTKKQGGLRASFGDKTEDHSERPDDKWFFAPGKQYMEIAKKGCPPNSPARSNMTIKQADALYKEPTTGIVTNFNLSTDLCTVGPAVQDLHGMLYSPSSIIATHKLVPMFGECKVSINNDILFPANMYYRHDDRYDYNPKEDLDWRNKQETVIWRGVTSGGVQLVDNFDRMHRQRLVQLLNGTYMGDNGKEVTVLTEVSPEDPAKSNITYEPYTHFRPSEYATQHTDIGFTEPMSCIPNCSFYDSVFKWVDPVSMTSQFKSKFVIDVDGHSFSGRWHAFLQSKSLGLKATIFREWHDSRLFAWRHFVPVDNRYDDLYALLTYFTGYGRPYGRQHENEPTDPNEHVFIAPHDKEAQKLARQGREWANKVLRREDIEVYMFRLLLEYGRVIDDNRDRIGYGGDGSELDRFDAGEEDVEGRWGIGGW
jgi:hypothetical protein